MGSTRLTSIYGTSSDTEEGNFENPKDASDIIGLEADVNIGKKTQSTPRAPTPTARRPPMGGINLGKGPDLGKAANLEKPRAAPRSAIGIEIGKSPANNLGIGIDVPIPIPAPISARGSVAIDPATGKIRGGGLGIGLGKGPIGITIDIGADTPKDSEKFGCFKYATVSVSIFSHTFGKNECEPTPTPTPTPTPIPSPEPFDYPIRTSNNVGCTILFGIDYHSFQWNDRFNTNYKIITLKVTGNYSENSGIGNTKRSEIAYNSFGEIISKAEQDYSYPFSAVINGGYYPEYEVSTDFGNRGHSIFVRGRESNIYRWIRDQSISLTGNTLYDYAIHQTKYKVIGFGTNCRLITPTPIPVSTPMSPSSPPSLPNSPPRKKMDNDCCEITKALQLETLRMLGRQVVGGKLVAISTAKGFIGEEIERTKTPIEDVTKPEKIKIKFATLYEMIVYSLKQANNLDTALDPQSYKPPTGYLQNPKYSRDSQKSLTDNRQPKTDKAGNKREFRINKDDDEAKFSGFIQQQCYLFEMVKRLEYLFPSGELEDAKIEKSLLIPGQKGDVKIHNMIQFQELFVQYLNASLGDFREPVVIKDANPIIQGDQKMEFKALSLAHLVRELFKFQMDMKGDTLGVSNASIRSFRTLLAMRIQQVQMAAQIEALFEDSGMLEDQKYEKVPLEGDPYGGHWIEGKGFEPSKDLDANTEEATEKLLQATLKNFTAKVKVSRRSSKEKTDMRDLIRGLADFVQRLFSVTATPKAIDDLVENAKFRIKTDMALIRSQVAKAAASPRSRTRKKPK